MLYIAYEVKDIEQEVPILDLLFYGGRIKYPFGRGEGGDHRKKTMGYGG